MSDLSTDLWDLLPCGFAPNVSDTIFVIKGFDSSDAASAFGARDCSSGFLCPSQHVLSQHPEIFNLKKKNNPARQFSTTTRHAFFLQGVCFVRSCGVTSYQLLGEFSGVLVFYTSLRTANFGGVTRSKAARVVGLHAVRAPAFALGARCPGWCGSAVLPEPPECKACVPLPTWSPPCPCSQCCRYH